MRHLAKVNHNKLTEHYDLLHHDYAHLKTHHDKKNKIAWLYMNNNPRPYFTPQLLNDLAHYHRQIQVEMEMTEQDQYDYLVFASDNDDIFSLGRDLPLIYSLIKQQNREQLTQYAKSCLAPLYQHLTHLNSELKTISLVQGDALGGGFEAALSTDLIIAEKGSKFGFPDVLFHSFPSMGGFSLLSRKVGHQIAENITLSGQLFTAEALFEIGVIDILAEQGEAELELYQYIKGRNPAAQQQHLIKKVKQASHPIHYQELIDMTEAWVDAILKTSEKDLRMMQRLIMRQTQQLSS